ncbi:MAG: malto-oligosyltrehalose synthase [Actinomycetota bacterium]|nr:malto-oligosyltrehalose synthase [Actinomycetota bacterium]
MTRAMVATYRLQFGDGFALDDARRALPYLQSLGVSDLYASPLLAARPGTSGYHVTDPTQIAPELGGSPAFEALTGELRERGMGLVLDIVPNHMAASSENRWWMDVLRRGRESQYASFFDVDWERHGGKLFVPVLGASLDEVLECGELVADDEGDEPVLRYHEHVFPVAPGTGGGGRDVPAVLEAQGYILGHWRDAAERINYRRFFDISDLVSLRQEDPRVFEATHALVLELVEAGRVTGLRVDHVDGLRDPTGYLERLRGAVGPDVPIWVEKILGDDETLPPEWPVQGTTGYEFASALGDVFVDPDGVEELRVFGASFSERPEDFEELAAKKQRQVMDQLFSGQLGSVVADLRAALGPHASDDESLRAALAEVTARLPVYRTYIRGREVSQRDRRFIERAARDARRGLRGRSRAAVELVRSVLLLERGGRHALELVLRWQQLTGPVTAKGVEDTALYDYPLLISRNDVGAHPGTAAGGPEAFHRMCRARARAAPTALSATSTHDSKRSEDVRAVLSVLSEEPSAWSSAVRRWSDMAARWKQPVDGELVPDASEELLIYQTLVGVWPLDAADEAGLAARIESFARKAAREAKVHTSWMEPNEKHEDALLGFVRALMGPEGAHLRSDLQAFRRRIEIAGVVNALAQVVVKVAAPGIPDFYRGTETWFLRLVDPDNREPFDLDRAAEMLASLPEDPDELLRGWRDGRLKLHVVRAALALRRNDPELFTRGSYIPIEARGPRANSVLAFARRLRSRWAVAVVPRLVLDATEPDRFPIGPATWNDTTLALPDRAPHRWRNVFTGAEISVTDGVIGLVDLLDRLPFALIAV